MEGWELTTTEGDLPENVHGVYLTSNSFVHFGVPTLVGRGLLPSDAPEVRIPRTWPCWVINSGKDITAGDPDIVGKNIH